MDDLTARHLIESLGHPGEDRDSLDHLELVHRILRAWIAAPGSSSSQELVRHAVEEFDTEGLIYAFIAVSSTLASTRADLGPEDVLAAISGAVGREPTVAS